MKKILLPLCIMATIVTSPVSAQQPATDNPLLKEFNTPHGVPPFEQIKTEDFPSAIRAAIEITRVNINKITNNSASPTFANTVEALEFSQMDLDRIMSVFNNLMGAETNDRLQQIAVELSPELTAFGNDISLNSKLFARVKKVYENRDKINLTGEQLRLLEKQYKSFVRSGADLSEVDKDKYRKITEQLSLLSLKFGENLLKATNDYIMHLTDKSQTAGLPDMIVEAAAMEAKSRNLDGWVFTLQAPSYVPFMSYADNRELREKLWIAYSSRCCTDGELDNKENIRKIVDLRLEMANLLGYKTYADFVLEERMAKAAPAVTQFLDQLLEKTIPYAKKDVADVEQYARANGFAADKFMPWDFSYYSIKYKDDKYNLNDEMTRPYFKLENMEKGMLELASRLYGITFTENKNIPVYHPDVRSFEVYDKDNRFLSVLYIDYFPRAGKRGGAWMSTFREQMIVNGKEIRPIVTLVCNFTQPTETSPSLLTFMEATTMLHEFGHGLHGILAEGSYPSITGTAVYRDFVELPSQLMENWMTEKEFLDMFAVHYQTGEKMPQELIDKIIAAKNFNAGYAQIRQLSFGIGDMAWHSIEKPMTGNIADFEYEAVAKTQVLPTVEGICFAPSFSHVFSGGYAAGYYSYKWAEVLEADAFQMFKDNGVFSRKVAQAFRDNVLSRGGTEHPMDLYVKFRGSEPSMDALMKKLGMN